MISFLRGIIDNIDNEYVYIDCSGIGYKVMMPAFDIAQLGTIGDNVKVYTHFHITENEMSLYGFYLIEAETFLIC